MRVNELAKKLGISADSIRYYPPGVRLVVASPDSPNLNRGRKELCNVALFC